MSRSGTAGRTAAACVLLGVVLVLPAMRAGFFADDYLQIAQLERWSRSPARALDLYSFVPRDRALVQRLRDDGTLPFFAAPGLRVTFLRPLSSALMWLDHSLFGRWAAGYHLDSLLWYAATLVAAAALLRRVLPGALGTLALLIFCVDDAHVLAVTFIAARNAAVSSALAWLALIAHRRWRTERWRAGAVLAPVLAALALAGGEMGLGALAYLVAWEVCQRGPGATRTRAVAPVAALVAVYLVIYVVTGSGAHGSAAYLDPFGAPLDFLLQLPGRLLLLLGGLLVSAPIDFVLFDARLRAPLMAIGGAATLVVAVWLPRALRRMTDEEATVVRWMALGAAGALLVSAPGLPGERVLLAASLGGAVVIAALLRDAWRLRRARAVRVLPALALAVFGLPNLVLAVVALPGKTILFGAMFDEDRRIARTAEIAAPVPARVVVVGLDDLLAVDLPAVRAFELGLSPDQLRAIGGQSDDRGRQLPLPDRIGYLGTTVLSLASTAHRLQRTAADTLELSTPDGTLLDGVWAGTLRARSLPMPRGTVTRTSFMTATVVDDRGGQPTRVRFRFDRALDDPALVFLIPSRGDLRRLIMPPIGGAISIPRPLPFGSQPPGDGGSAGARPR